MRIHVFFTKNERKQIRKMVKHIPFLKKRWERAQAYLWTCVRNKPKYVEVDYPDLKLFWYWNRSRVYLAYLSLRTRIRDLDRHCEHCGNVDVWVRKCRNCGYPVCPTCSVRSYGWKSTLCVVCWNDGLRFDPGSGELYWRDPHPVYSPCDHCIYGGNQECSVPEDEPWPCGLVPVES